LVDGVLEIRAFAHSIAFAERPLPAGVSLIQCAISLGTDNGAAWGPGLAVVWSDRILRINVRRDGRFGFDDGSRSMYRGSITRDGWNHVAVRISAEEVHFETSTNSELWNVSHTFPRRRLCGEALSLRIGKMGRHGKDDNFSAAGTLGVCAITGLQILGQQTTRTWFSDPPEQNMSKKPHWVSLPKSCHQSHPASMLPRRPIPPLVANAMQGSIAETP
jgi:hypothetical protein